MINKIKELMQIKQDIDQIKQQTESNTEVTKEFNEKVTSLESDIQNLKKAMNEFLSEFKSNRSMFSNIREDLSKEVYDFKMLKAQLQRKLVEKFEEELQKELKINVDKLRDDMENYEDVKSVVKEAMSKVDMTKHEMSKWLAISENIKQADFELSKHAKKLQDSDREKLELMKRIDSLERMIAKMKRSSPERKAMY